MSRPNLAPMVDLTVLLLAAVMMWVPSRVGEGALEERLPTHM